MNRSRGLRAATALVALATIVAGCGGTPFAVVGPVIADPRQPAKQNTHWHAALGVYKCDHWMGDATGPGVWNWPVATPNGSPGRAFDPLRYAGLHSHDDGIIHMEPLVPEEAGRGATLGRYFDYGGWRVSATGYSFLGTTVRNDDLCGSTPGRLMWEHATWDGTTGRQHYTVMQGDPARYKLREADIVVLAFLAPGASIASIGDPPSLADLAGTLGLGARGPVSS